MLSKFLEGLSWEVDGLIIFPTSLKDFLIEEADILGYLVSTTTFLVCFVSLIELREESSDCSIGNDPIEELIIFDDCCLN